MRKRLAARMFFASVVFMGGGLLFAEPGIRGAQSANAAQWQLYWGNEYDSCEGCCGVGFCCTINSPCAYVIET